MKLSAIQQRRFDAAVRALRLAGGEELPGRLEKAFGSDDRAEIAAVLNQARAWASGMAEVPAGPVAPPLAASVSFALAARDAPGLLWAVLG